MPDTPYTQVKFERSAPLWSVKGFLHVELPVDIRIFHDPCLQMEAILRRRTAITDYQNMTYQTTALAARRVCTTVKDWPHLFGDTQRTGDTPSEFGRRLKRQLLIGAAWGTVFAGIMWNQVSDWVSDTTATDAIERL